jgi:peptidoglycan/LPS O-acetylase OafA/YrhL
MKELNTNIFDSKHHFIILDGLRGVAAISIVVFHFMEWVYTDATENFIGHGFLAVDFFFCLSGFVIAYAYDDRISKMGIFEFFKSRIIRLHPLVICGSVLGLIGYLFDPFGGHPELYGAGKLALIFLTSVFLIPYPVMQERYYNLFSLNAPTWSLFWEYVANVFYAILLCKLSRKYLLLLTIFAGSILIYVSYNAGSLLGGWAGENFWDGAARISFSFLAGILIFRYNWAIKTKFNFIGLAFLLILAFIIPGSKYNWVVEPIIVLFYFPFLIILGVGASLSLSLKKFCILLGKISYPLYMTHYAAIWVFGNYFVSHKIGTSELLLIVPIGTILLIGFAYIVMILYDTPIRNYFTEMRKKNVEILK